MQEPSVNQSTMTDPTVGQSDKMKKLEKRLTGDQQTNIEALNKTLYEDRPIPDFSHCWGLHEMSPKQLEFVESQKKRKKAKKHKKVPTAGIEVVQKLGEEKS